MLRKFRHIDHEKKGFISKDALFDLLSDYQVNFDADLRGQVWEKLDPVCMHVYTYVCIYVSLVHHAF